MLLLAAALTVNQTNVEGVGDFKNFVVKSKINAHIFPPPPFTPTAHDVLQPLFLFHETHLIRGRKAKPQ